MRTGLSVQTRFGLRWALVGGVTLALAGTAVAASSASDPKGDVNNSCARECSEYSVDLKAISLSRANGNLLIKVAQYGPFYAAQPLYWPQIELFTKSSPHGAPKAPFQGSSADFSLYVGYGSGGVCHRPGKGYEMDLLKGTTKIQAVSCQWPSHSTIVYKVPLSKLGNPKRVRARAWQGGVDANSKPVVLDVAPDTGTVGG